MLLLDGEEMLVGLAVGKDDGFAAEGANLGAADVEDIAVAGQVGQGDVVALGHQAVAQSCAVNVERNFVVLADLVEVVQLAGGIERAQLGGEGDVDQARMHGMVLVAVVHVVVEVLVQHLGFHLAVRVGDGDDFVLCELHGTRLVDIDVSRADADDALILIEH